MSKSKEYLDNLKLAFIKNGLVLLEEYKGANTKVLAHNEICGHDYLVTPSVVSRGRYHNCPICTPRRSKSTYSNEQYIKELDALGLEAIDTYSGMKALNLIRNKTCGHEYRINPGHLFYDKHGITCPVCVANTKNRFFSKLLENSLTAVDNYTTCQESIEIINTKCNHQYSVIPNNLVTSNTGIICRLCTPVSSISKAEKELREFVEANYTGWIEYNDRTILEGKELDIVLPDLGLAIEYDGIRWHDSSKKPEAYHLDKTNKTEAFGFRLIHVTETEWLAKKDIVKSRLLSVLGKSTKIYARKTQLKEIPFPREFLETNHIQGAGTITKYNYGLFLESELVAVMTFSQPRFTTNCNYELVRYCSKLGTNIIGGASKLLKAFTNKYGTSIVSYSDRRWSQGNLYKQLGFEFSHNSKPNYRYHKYKYELSRYQCTKQQLKTKFPEFYSDELTETEIMQLAGYYKVFDCGSGVWILK